MLQNVGTHPLQNILVDCSNPETPGQLNACTAALGLSAIAAIAISLVFALLAFIAQIGVQRAAIRSTQGVAPTFSEMFTTQYLGRYILYMIVFAIFGVLGLILCILPGLLVFFFLQLGPYYILDKGMSVGDAFKASYTAVSKNVGPGADHDDHQRPRADPRRPVLRPAHPGDAAVRLPVHGAHVPAVQPGAHRLARSAMMDPDVMTGPDDGEVGAMGARARVAWVSLLAGTLLIAVPVHGGRRAGARGVVPGGGGRRGRGNRGLRHRLDGAPRDRNGSTGVTVSMTVNPDGSLLWTRRRRSPTTS